MQNYPNSNYYSQYQPQFNPYMQRMENLQQFQQALQQPISPAQMSATTQFAPMGKIVESMDIVRVTDIPMDGNMYYFPTADGSTIFGKRWLANGQTQILAFKPILEEEMINSSINDLESVLGANTSVLEGITESLNNLHEKIDKISKQNTTSRAKKGEISDE